MDSPLNDWGTLGPAAIDSGLADLNLSFDRDNKAVICTRCKYALQPSGQTVSKHLWERYAVDAKRRRGLHALINSVKLPDPNTLCTPPDGTRPHPYSTVHEGFACRRCDFRTTSTELAQRHVAKMHGKNNMPVFPNTWLRIVTSLLSSSTASLSFGVLLPWSAVWRCLSFPLAIHLLSWLTMAFLRRL
jgi:hypothetical protein